MSKPGQNSMLPGTLLVLACAVVAGCGPSQHPTGSRSADDPTDTRTRAVGLFARNCVGCHGAGGKLGPAPPLADPLWQALITDDEIHQLVTGGRPGTLMPAFAEASGGTLTAEQVAALVTEVRALILERDETSHPPPLTSDLVGDAQRGAGLFAAACAGCHGPQGEGSEAAGAVNDPAFLQLASDRLLRRTIIVGRADLGMPNFAQTTGRAADFEPLADQQVADLVALLAQWRHASSD